MIRINLLPIREERRRESARQYISICVLSMALLLVFIALVHIRMGRKIDSLNSEIKTTQEEVNRLTAIVGDVKRYEKRKKELQEKIRIIEMLNSKKTGPVRMLDGLGQNTPGKLWVTSLKEDNLKLTLNGIALDNETIARFMRNLEGSPRFSGIELIESQQNIQGEMKLESFNINCQVVLPEKK